MSCKLLLRLLQELWILNLCSIVKCQESLDSKVNSSWSLSQNWLLLWNLHVNFTENRDVVSSVFVLGNCCWLDNAFDFSAELALETVVFILQLDELWNWNLVLLIVNLQVVPYNWEAKWLLWLVLWLELRKSKSTSEEVEIWLVKMNYCLLKSLAIDFFQPRILFLFFIYGSSLAS